MNDMERKIYHEIIVDTWSAFRDDYGEEFSDEWWKKIIAKMDSIASKYKYDDCASFLVSNICMLFLDTHERRQKHGEEIQYKAGS